MRVYEARLLPVAALAMAVAGGAARLAAQDVPGRRPGSGGVGISGSVLFVTPHLGWEVDGVGVHAEATLGAGTSELIEALLSATRDAWGTALVTGGVGLADRGDRGVRLVERGAWLGADWAGGGARFGLARARADVEGFEFDSDTKEARAWIDLGPTLGLTYRQSRLEQSGEFERDTMHVILDEFVFRTRRSSRFFREEGYSELEIDVGFDLGPVLASVSGGHRFGDGEAAPGVSWAFGTLRLPVGTRTELVAEVGRNSGVPSVGRGPAGFFRAGVRFDLNAPRPRPEAIRRGEARMSARTAEAPTLGVVERNGSRRLVLWSESARSVEIKGDFTDWDPAPLERGEGGRWTWTRDVVPGVYHLNIRVNDGPWTVPSNLPVANDEFGAGQVALLVVR